MTATLLFSSMTVNAAEVSMTSKQNADYMMSTNKDGAPNWFNGTYYSDRYSDLKAAFNTNEKALYNHSLQYGFNEARLVTPVLDVAKYRAFYPDLNKAFGDNWNLYVRHYFEYGINEGRENFTDFDAKTYLSMYADLQNAFGYDLGLATRHYIEYGISEGREYNYPEPEIVYEEPDNDNDDDNNSSDSGPSDSGSSDDDNTEEKFTGDKRVEHEDGGYIIATYVNGILAFDKFYDEDGTLVNETTYTYDTNDNMVSSQTKDASGNLIVEGTYYESGASKTNTLYEADGKKSFYEELDEQSNITLYIDYQEDGITEEYKAIYTYDENGNLKSEKTTWADGSTTEMTYENGVRAYQIDIHADGMKFELEYYEDGYTQKKSTEINTDGTKFVVENHENGNSKSYTWYDTSGNMTRQQLYDEDGNLTYDSDDSSSASPSNATPSE